jgi:hypothetical protein
VLPVLALVALVALFVAVRVVRGERRPTEIDRFRAATELTTAWSRGEEWPPAYPQEPVARSDEHEDGQPTDWQGLSRSSRT